LVLPFAAIAFLIFSAILIFSKPHGGRSFRVALCCLGLPLWAMVFWAPLHSRFAGQLVGKFEWAWSYGLSIALIVSGCVIGIATKVSLKRNAVS
jgi:hypothetical protein